MKKGLGVDGGIARLCLEMGFGGIPRQVKPALLKAKGYVFIA